MTNLSSAESIRTVTELEEDELHDLKQFSAKMQEAATWYTCGICAESMSMQHFLPELFSVLDDCFDVLIGSDENPVLLYPCDNGTEIRVCHKLALKAKKIPEVSLANQLSLGEISEVLKCLNGIEQK